MVLANTRDVLQLSSLRLIGSSSGAIRSLARQFSFILVHVRKAVQEDIGGLQAIIQFGYYGERHNDNNKSS